MSHDNSPYPFLSLLPYCKSNIILSAVFLLSFNLVYTFKGSTTLSHSWDVFYPSTKRHKLVAVIQFIPLLFLLQLLYSFLTLNEHVVTYNYNINESKGVKEKGL